MRLSGWCSPDCSPRSHATCQERLERGLLDECGCKRNGGHDNTEEAA